MGQLLKIDSRLSRTLLSTSDNRLYYMLEELVRKLNAKFSAIESSVVNTLVVADGIGNLTEGGAIEGSVYAIASDAPSELTIVSGAVTVPGTLRVRYHTIDTEGDAASDDLDTITGGNVGDFLIIEAASSARTVVCINGASLRIGRDFSLDHASDKLFCLCTSSGVWDQIFRSSNA